MPSTSLLHNASIPVGRLQPGHSLEHAIFDENGVLLLASGTTITSEFLQRLQRRQITEVFSENEVNAAATASRGSSPASKLDFAHFDELQDSISESGFFASSEAASLRESVVFHGRNGYDPKVRQKLLSTHEEACESLDGLMARALQGEQVDSQEMLKLVGTYVSALTADSDQIMSIATAVSENDCLSSHCLRTAVLALAIGIEMGLHQRHLRQLGLVGLLHDWGMVRVPERIREASHSLSDVEMLHIRKHPMYTLQLLEGVQGVSKVVALSCYQVHERPNGSGYPNGRQHIHIFARIVSVADIYTALTSKRSHRAPWMPYAAMECLLRHAQDRDVDADVVRALLNVLSLFPIGSYVQLDDQSTAVVLRRSGADYSRPIVRILRDATGVPVSEDDPASIVDLSNDTRSVVRAVPNQELGEMSYCSSIMTRRG